MNTNTTLIHNGTFQSKHVRPSPPSRGGQSYPNLMGQRVVYWPAGTGYLERFQTWDHARDECRTLARRLIRWCKRNDMPFIAATCLGYGLPSGVVGGEFKAIIRKHPPEVVRTTVTALMDFERRTGQDVRQIISIRPCIGRDKSTSPFPYRVVDVRLSVR